MTPKHKRLTKKVDSRGNETLKLTKTEKEVLYLLTVEFLTPNQVAVRRGTTPEAVYKILRILNKKGAITRNYEKVDFFRGTTQPFNGIRVHGLEFNIKIISKNKLYNDMIKKSNIRMVDGNTIRFYAGSLEVYGNKSFFGEDEQKAMSKAFNYFNRLFIRLERDLKVILLKPRHQNISIVKCEFAEVQNELAKSCGDRADKVKVYAREDGVLWFSIDNSFNLHEAETHHRETAKRDMVAVRKQLNDWRDNNPPTMSELSILIKDLTLAQLNTVELLNSIITLIKPPQVKCEPFKQEDVYYVG